MKNIRLATSADAEAIAHVHVETWKTTYADFMPADFLASLSTEKRAGFWQNELATPAKNKVVLVAEKDAAIAGFLLAGPSRERIAEGGAEIYALYVLAARQRKGLGRELFEEARRLLLAAGLPRLHAWVVKGNPAEMFYLRMGGMLFGEKLEETAGVALKEHGYEWGA